jgi:hypothetical protein
MTWASGLKSCIPYRHYAVPDHSIQFVLLYVTVWCPWFSPPIVEAPLQCCCARSLSNALAVLSLAFQCPGEPFLLSLMVHIAHGIPILMRHLGQAAVHLPTSPHTKVWMAIVEATRPEDRGPIWGRLCNVLPCSCLNTLWESKTCRRGSRQPWNLQAHIYHVSIVLF